MSIYMVTAGEISFIREVLYDLSAVADPSEYLEEDVKEAMRILDTLQTYESSKILDAVEMVQASEKEEENKTRKELDNERC